jgi:hypothetical protein
VWKSQWGSMSSTYRGHLEAARAKKAKAVPKVAEVDSGVGGKRSCGVDINGLAALDSTSTGLTMEVRASKAEVLPPPLPLREAANQTVVWRGPCPLHVTRDCSVLSPAPLLPLVFCRLSKPPDSKLISAITPAADVIFQI